MKHLNRLVAAAAIAALPFTVAPFAAPMALAETPADTFIQAWTIDDMISLDPAEVFEFSASEVLGNSYEPLLSYDLNDVSKLFGVVADT